MKLWLAANKERKKQTNKISLSLVIELSGLTLLLQRLATGHEPESVQYTSHPDNIFS